MIEVDLAQPDLHEVVSSASRLDTVAHGLLFGEGPVWHSAEACLYWADILGDTIWRWRPRAGAEIVMRPSGKANGMTFDRTHRRVVAGWSSRSIWRAEHDGSITTLATHFNGHKINTPNDVVVSSGGAIYWTDCSGALFIPGMDGGDLQRYLDTHPVFRLSPDEQTITLLTDDMPYPNGLAFSPDESLLYVADTYQSHVRAFSMHSDGTFADNGPVLYTLVGDEPGVADGLKVDSEGNIYVTGPGGIHVVTPLGRLMGRLRIPGHVTNMAWGDHDWRTLYITTYSSVYRIRLRIPGLPVPARSAA